MKPYNMKYILNACCRDIYKRQQDLKIKDGYYCRILKKVYFYRILKHYHSGPRKICFPQCIKVLLVISPTTVQCQKLSFVNIWQLLFALSCLLLTETTWTIILVIFGKTLRVKLTYNRSLFMRWKYIHLPTDIQEILSTYIRHFNLLICLYNAKMYTMQSKQSKYAYIYALDPECILLFA